MVLRRPKSRLVEVGAEYGETMHGSHCSCEMGSKWRDWQVFTPVAEKETDQIKIMMIEDEVEILRFFDRFLR